jgi:hypothetical protein
MVRGELVKFPQGSVWVVDLELPDGLRQVGFDI